MRSDAARAVGGLGRAVDASSPEGWGEESRRTTRIVEDCFRCARGPTQVPPTRARVRLLGPCFKTGRVGDRPFLAALARRAPPSAPRGVRASHEGDGAPASGLPDGAMAHHEREPLQPPARRGVRAAPRSGDAPRVTAPRATRRSTLPRKGETRPGRPPRANVPQAYSTHPRRGDARPAAAPLRDGNASVEGGLTPLSCGTWPTP